MKKILSVMLVALCVIGLMVSCDHEVGAEDGNYLVKIELAGTGTQYDGAYYVKDATDHKDDGGYYRVYFDAGCTNLISFIDSYSEANNFNFNVGYDSINSLYGFNINFSESTSFGSIPQAQTAWTHHSTSLEDEFTAGVYTFSINDNNGTMTVTIKQDCIIHIVSN